MIHLDRRVGGKLQIGQQRRQKKKLPARGSISIVFFPEPAEAGEPGELPLRERCRIDHAAGAAARHAGFQPGTQFVHPAAEQVVIVGAPRIAGHAAPALPPLRPHLLWRDRGRRMIGGKHDYAPHTGKQVRRVGTQRFLPFEPFPKHTRKALIEPSADQLPPRGRPGRGDAQSRKAHPDRLPSQFFQEQAAVLAAAGWV